jgi:flagellar biosynthesis protein FliR
MIIMLEQFPVFLLAMLRIMSFLVTVPIFSYRNIPTGLKVGLGFFLTLLVLPSIQVQQINTIDEYFLILVLKEVVVGLAVGFIAAMIFYAIQIAGAFIDLQMGFAMANIFDPQTGIQTPITGRYFYIFAILLLLSIDGHHMLINGIMNSFDLVPIDQIVLFNQTGSIAHFVMITFKKMFLIAFQMAFPIVVCLFLVDLALGLVARTVPQLNIFVVGFPLKIFVGFVVILMIISTVFFLIQKIFKEMMDSMGTLLKLFGGF